MIKLNKLVDFVSETNKFLVYSFIFFASISSTTFFFHILRNKRKSYIILATQSVQARRRSIVVQQRYFYDSWLFSLENLELIKRLEEAADVSVFKL